MGTDAQVVVVGAGHNGLIAAAYLARAGVDTVVVEARDQVGGCASTVAALGARVNICNCDHLAVRSLPLVDELDLAAHGLRYLDLDPAQVCLSWTADRPAVLFHDVDRTLDSLALTLPDQVDGYRRYVLAARPVARLVLDLAASSPTPGHVARTVGRGLPRNAAAGARLLAWSRRSAAEVLRSFLSSETLLGAALATGPGVWGVSPHQPGTGLGALRLAMPHLVPPGRPVGGSGALTDAVRASLEAAGGRVRCGQAAARILVERDAVAGVRLSSGEELRSDCVVVACDPRDALLDWLGWPPPGPIAGVVARWQRRPVLDGYESKVDAVVDAPPAYDELDPALLAVLGADPLVPTTVIAPGVDGIAAARRVADAGGVAERPIFLANVPSVADPTLRPASGGHVFSLETLFTPYARNAGWSGADEPRRWLEVFASKVAPGFLDGVRAVRAMTPDVYERDFGLRRGYAPSFAGGPVAALLGRDPELSRYRTPLAGLYLTGAATFPGAGVWGAPGRNAAGVVLADLQRPRPAAGL
jgi:phytoene dehydrogenase-like protein